MTASSSWASGHLRELDISECLELTSAKSVGRVAFCTDEGPMVLPVNYVVHDMAVVLRTAPDSSIARHAQGSPMTLEVDEVDEYTQSGWSVVFTGTAEVVDGDDLPAAARPLPWPEQSRWLFVRVPARSITGRWLYPS
jgi:nitroimidazol reductase NimA-like FMN-containing flavoprotein (pyridoxamine 5'-phosphate oxidase superfamily)